MGKVIDLNKFRADADGSSGDPDTLSDEGRALAIPTADPANKNVAELNRVSDVQAKVSKPVASVVELGEVRQEEERNMARIQVLIDTSSPNEFGRLFGYYVDLAFAIFYRYHNSDKNNSQIEDNKLTQRELVVISVLFGIDIDKLRSMPFSKIVELMPIENKINYAVYLRDLYFDGNDLSDEQVKFVYEALEISEDDFYDENIGVFYDNNAFIVDEYEILQRQKKMDDNTPDHIQVGDLVFLSTTEDPVGKLLFKTLQSNSLLLFTALKKIYPNGEIPKKEAPLTMGFEDISTIISIEIMDFIAKHDDEGGIKYLADRIVEMFPSEEVFDVANDYVIKELYFAIKKLYLSDDKGDEGYVEDDEDIDVEFYSDVEEGDNEEDEYFYEEDEDEDEDEEEEDDDDDDEEEEESYNMLVSKIEAYLRLLPVVPAFTGSNAKSKRRFFHRLLRFVDVEHSEQDLRKRVVFIENVGNAPVDKEIIYSASKNAVGNFDVFHIIIQLLIKLTPVYESGISRLLFQSKHQEIVDLFFEFIDVAKQRNKLDWYLNHFVENQDSFDSFENLEKTIKRFLNDNLG